MLNDTIRYIQENPPVNVSTDVVVRRTNDVISKDRDVGGGRDDVTEKKSDVTSGVTSSAKNRPSRYNEIVIADTRSVEDEMMEDLDRDWKLLRSINSNSKMPSPIKPAHQDNGLHISDEEDYFLDIDHFAMDHGDDVIHREIPPDDGVGHVTDPVDRKNPEHMDVDLQPADIEASADPADSTANDVYRVYRYPADIYRAGTSFMDLYRRHTTRNDTSSSVDIPPIPGVPNKLMPDLFLAPQKKDVPVPTSTTPQPPVSSTTSTSTVRPASTQPVHRPTPKSTPSPVTSTTSQQTSDLVSTQPSGVTATPTADPSTTQTLQSSQLVSTQSAQDQHTQSTNRAKTIVPKSQTSKTQRSKVMMTYVVMTSY